MHYTEIRWKFIIQIRINGPTKRQTSYNDSKQSLSVAITFIPIFLFSSREATLNQLPSSSSGTQFPYDYVGIDSRKL